MRLLVTGFGSIGQRHAANLRRLHPEAEIAVLRSGIGGRDSPLPAGIDLQLYAIEEAVRFMPRAAVVATPAPFHVATARQLLEAGCHVLIEKPLADRLDGIAEMEAIAGARGLVAMVGYNLIFSPAMQALANAVRAGRAGPVFAVKAEVGQYLPDWRPGTDYRRSASARRELGGGVLLELSHEIHYLLWLFGPVHSVQATVLNTGLLEIDVEDYASLNLVFGSGIVANLQMDFLRRTYTRVCTVFGRDGTLTWDGRRQTVESTTPGQGGPVVLHAEDTPDRNLSYLRELEHFLACIDGREQPQVSTADATAVLQVVLAARRSAAATTTVLL